MYANLHQQQLWWNVQNYINPSDNSKPCWLKICSVRSQFNKSKTEMQNNTFWIQPLSNEGNILPDLAKKLSEKTSAIKSSDFVEQSNFIRQNKACSIKLILTLSKLTTKIALNGLFYIQIYIEKVFQKMLQKILVWTS